MTTFSIVVYDKCNQSVNIHRLIINNFELSENLVEMQRKITTIINIIGNAGGKSDLDVLSMQVWNMISYLFFTVPANLVH